MKLFGLFCILQNPSVLAHMISYCRTDIDEARVISFLGSTSAHVKIQIENQFRPFLKENQIFWVSCCSTREDLSIDVSITTVRLILTKLG